MVRCHNRSTDTQLILYGRNIQTLCSLTWMLHLFFSLDYILWTFHSRWKTQILRSSFIICSTPHVISNVPDVRIDRVSTSCQEVPNRRFFVSVRILSFRGTCNWKYNYLVGTYIDFWMVWVYNMWSTKFLSRLFILRHQYIVQLQL